MESFNLLVKETTAQELFDHVCKHLGDQGKPAKTFNQCSYRQDELSCAIGGCFSDDHYQESMDEYSGIGAKALIRGYFPEAEHLADLSDRLQAAHDDSNHLVTLVSQLKEIAKDHGLDTTEVDNITEWNYDDE